MRRRILLLSVGMTTLVVLAFAVPLVILLRTTTAGEAKDKALYRAETVAYYVGDRNHTADDITAYIDGLRDGPGSISVRMPDGTTLGDPPPGGVPTPKSLPDDYNDDDGDGKGPPKLGDADYRDLNDGMAVDVAVDTPAGPASVCLYLTADELYDRGREALAELEPITLAGFRDALGVGRRTAQLLLERYDADGLTVRRGDVRTLRRAHR